MASTGIRAREVGFALEFMKDFIGARAIVRAGITTNKRVAKVYAHRYLRRPRVRAKLGEERDWLLSQKEISPARAAKLTALNGLLEQ